MRMPWSRLGWTLSISQPRSIRSVRGSDISNILLRVDRALTKTMSRASYVSANFREDSSLNGEIHLRLEERTR